MFYRLFQTICENLTKITRNFYGRYDLL